MTWDLIVTALLIVAIEVGAALILAGLLWLLLWLEDRQEARRVA